MLINGTPLEKCCKNLLQQNLTFEIKNKSLKSGKMILFYQKNFYLVFVINTDKKDKDKIEIPIPFQIEEHPSDNLIYFDYRISTLQKHFQDAEPYISLYTPKKNLVKNKFFDNILVISKN